MGYIGNSLIEIAVLVDDKPLQIYNVDGVHWIAGVPGKPYVIRVRNLSGGRLNVLESVDGRDVLHDKPASYKNMGMVITGTWDNRGWRLDDNRVREFVFGDPSESIAARATGSTANVGVIGIAYFTEAVRYMASSAYSATIDMMGVKSFAVSRGAGGQSLSDLGTGIGEEHQDRVGHTHFERATTEPARVYEIQYRTREWLVANGIIGDGLENLPSAFPGETTGYEKYS